MTDLIITSFSRNFTGVSASAAAVVRQQMARYDIALAGQSLPGCPDPVTRADALRLSGKPPFDKPFTIWHVRRNLEMRVALWARDVRRLPLKIVFTSAATRRHSAIPRWLISRMDAVIATTGRAAELVPHVAAIVPHGVDTELFFPAPDRAQAWKNTRFPGQKAIATIGRIRPEKGSDRFVDAMLQLLPDHPECTALLIGRASKSHTGYLTGLKAKVAAAGLADCILFPGEISPDKMPALMRSLSVMVQLPHYEGYGLAPLEGMASGVPFVATDAGNYRNFSDQGRAGVILPDYDAKTAAQTLSALLNDQARHAAMAKSARKAAETRFNIQAEADGIDTVYQQLWRAG